MFTEPETVQPESANMRPENIKKGMIFKTGRWVYKAGADAKQSADKHMYWFEVVFARRNGKPHYVGMIYLRADRVYEMRSDWNKPARAKADQA